MDEAVLINKAKKGDITAFEALIEDHQKRVYNIALRILNNSEDAYDAAQEVFIKVYKSIASFKGDSSFSTWIYRITKNVCLDEIRKRKKNKAISIDEEYENEEGSMQKQIYDDSPGPEEITERKIDKEQIYKAIELLSEQQKIVLVLRDIQGFSYEEIGKIIDCPEGTVKSRINRARKSLVELLRSKTELLDSKFVI